MTRQKEPQPTIFRKIGGTIYLKIPSDRVDFLGLEHLKDEDTENKAEAKIQAETNNNNQHYVSAWNPNHESQE